MPILELRGQFRQMLLQKSPFVPQWLCVTQRSNHSTLSSATMTVESLAINSPVVKRSGRLPMLRGHIVC
jgi:hypothetical protein